ncbi:MAG: sigma-54 dependent transcriptional regulator [Verrucomicrobiota bacterium]
MTRRGSQNLIDHALARSPQPVCIMMTAYGNVSTAVEAMKHGAFDFLTKPLNLEKLELVIKRALHSRKMESENKQLHQRLDRKFNFEGIVGNSSALNHVLDQVRQVAPSRATVMLYGDTGTGKELIAQMVHQNSDRARKPFVPVHCAAIPANLLESELFGHEKGAFTGAAERRIGRFEAADGGTLFLDEIGEIDAPTQVKLLRFLETRSFERLGSLKPIQVDVRLVCATNRDPKALADKGEFREDLYYRLNVVPIRLPSLKERPDDIPLLLDHFLRQFAEENGTEPVTLSPEAMTVLSAYPWPGNIRELRNFCENTVVMKRGGVLTEYDLEGRFFANAAEGKQPVASPGSESALANPLSKEENEKRLLRSALQKAGGNRTQAAQLMGISRRTLHRKLAQWPELDVQ